MRDLRIKKGTFAILLCTLMVFFAICASAEVIPFDWTAAENATGNIPVVHKHVYGEWKIRDGFVPDCKNPGKKYRECLFSYEGVECPHEYEEDIPKDPSYHVDVTETVIKEKTCSSVGQSKFSCSCGATEIVYSEKTEHTFEKEWTIVNPIHDETRSIDGTRSNRCSVCGTNVKETIPVEHNFDGDGTVITEATCIKKGSALKYCTVCKKTKMVETEIDPDNHVYSGKALPLGEITCQTGCKGLVICEECGETANVDIPADTNHEYLKWTYVEPTGTCKGGVNGYIQKFCDVHNKNFDFKSWKGHELGDDAKTHASTCSEPGYKKGTCTVCKAENAEVVLPIDPDAHSWIEEVLIEPTCTSEGYVFRICKYDSSHIEYSYIPATGHTYNDDWTVITEATCYTPGLKSNTCSVCQYYATENIPVDPDNHPIEESEWKIYKDQKPTCDKVGIEAASCKYCVRETDLIFREVPKHSGTLKEYSRIEPTCCLEGKVIYECYECGVDVEEVLEINPDAHKISTTYHVVKPATCEEEDLDGDGLVDGLGILSKVCEYCLIPFVDHEKDEEHPDGYTTFDRKSHVVTDWTIENSNCTKNGTKKRSCVNCGHIEVQSIPASHRYEAWVVDETYAKATCTTLGRRTRGCYNCTEYFEAEYYYADHDLGEWFFIAGDCKKGGTLRRECKNCNSHISQKTIEPGEHVNLVKGDIKYAISDSVCSQIIYTCTFCGGTVEERTSHMFTSYSSVEPYSDPHELCENELCEKEHKTINKKNYHLLCTDSECTKYHVPSENACEINGWTEKYYCMVCKHIVDQKYLPAMEHDFEYDDEGTKYCINCNLYYTEDGKVCDHFCHNRGVVARVMTKFFSFFWKILDKFSLEPKYQYCKCGGLHYQPKM